MQNVGQKIEFNQTEYEILNQLRFPATGNPRKEYIIQQLLDTNSHEVEIRIGWALDGQWQQQTAMISEVDYQRVKAETATW